MARINHCIRWNWQKYNTYVAINDYTRKNTQVVTSLQTNCHKSVQIIRLEHFTNYNLPSKVSWAGVPVRNSVGDTAVILTVAASYISICKSAVGDSPLSLTTFTVKLLAPAAALSGIVHWQMVRLTTTPLGKTKTLGGYSNNFFGLSIRTFEINVLSVVKFSITCFDSEKLKNKDTGVFQGV